MIREKLDPKVMIVMGQIQLYPFVLKILIKAFYEERFLLQTIIAYEKSNSRE